jgi:hypothetical protein
MVDKFNPSEFFDEYESIDSNKMKMKIGLQDEY